MGWQGKALLRRWHLSCTLEDKPELVTRKRGPSSGQKSKGARGKCLGQLRSQGASVAGALCTTWGSAGGGGRQGWEEASVRALPPQLGYALSSEKTRKPGRIWSRGLTRTVWLSYKKPVQKVQELFCSTEIFLGLEYLRRLDVLILLMFKVCERSQRLS